MLPNRLWVTEVSKLVMILAKNSVCSVVKKDENKDLNKMKLIRISKNKTKLKLPCNKRGIKCDLNIYTKSLV